MTLAGLYTARRPRGQAATTAPQAPEPAHAASLRRGQRAGRALLALVAGGVGWAAYPPVGWWPAALLSVALITLVTRGSSKRLAFALGLVYGLALFVPLLSWIATIGTDAWLLLAFTQALEMGVLGLGLRAVAPLRGWPLWAAGAWILEEALRGRYPLGGFTWGRWAYSQSASPMLHLAAWAGAPLVSFAVALTGSLLAWAVVAAWHGGHGGHGGPGGPGRGGQLSRPPVALAAVAALVLAPLLIRLPTAAQTAGGPAMVTAAVVQGNVPRLGLDLGAQRNAVTRNHLDATLALARDVAAGTVPRPDVVIWPENATDVDPRVDRQANAEVTRAAAALGVPLLVGAVLNGPGPTHLSNAGVVWDPVTAAGATYVKRHLVPFGEYIPLRAELGGLFDQFRLIPYDFAPGQGTGLLQLGPARIGDVICYEVAYDGLVRSSVVAGARVLVVQTNNATYGRDETSQQLAMARLRAVEHGREVLVASTSGISAIIAPDGRVGQRSKVFTRTVLVARVPLRDSLTIADRLGAGSEWALVGIGLVGCAAAVMRARRSRRRTT